MKVSTENDNNFGYEKIMILEDNIPLNKFIFSVLMAAIFDRGLCYHKQFWKWTNQRSSQSNLVYYIHVSGITVSEKKILKCFFFFNQNKSNLQINNQYQKLEAQPWVCVAHLSFCFEET
jgi:hypothetical protein